MQTTKIYQYLVTLLLILSIFSFSTTMLIEESSDLYYETLLDDNSEYDDKEESEKKLFILPTLLLSGFPTLPQKSTTLQTKLLKFKEFATPFRPPIVS